MFFLFLRDVSAFSNGPVADNDDVSDCFSKWLQQQFVDDRVKSGKYPDAAAVIEDPIALNKEFSEDQPHEPVHGETEHDATATS